MVRQLSRAQDGTAHRRTDTGESGPLMVAAEGHHQSGRGWACSACTLLNSEGESVCAACGSIRPDFHSPRGGGGSTAPAKPQHTPPPPPKPSRAPPPPPVAEHAFSASTHAGSFAPTTTGDGVWAGGASAGTQGPGHWASLVHPDDAHAYTSSPPDRAPLAETRAEALAQTLGQASDDELLERMLAEAGSNTTAGEASSKAAGGWSRQGRGEGLNDPDWVGVVAVGTGGGGCVGEADVGEEGDSAAQRELLEQLLAESSNDPDLKPLVADPDVLDAYVRGQQ